MVNLKGRRAATAFAVFISYHEVSDRLKETFSCCSQKDRTRGQGAELAWQIEVQTNPTSFLKHFSANRGVQESLVVLALTPISLFEALRALVLLQPKAVWV